MVTLNIWHDQQDWPTRLGMIVDGLHDLNADVICLQEVLQKEDLPNQAQILADRLGYRMYFSSIDPEDAVKRYGNAILTRHPVVESNWKALEPKNDYRTVAHVRIDVGGQPVNIYNTHLHHTPEGIAIRQRQAEDVMAFIEATRGNAPVILTGDFNALADAPELSVLRDGFVDAYGTLHPDDTGVTTLNAALGHSPRRIDHVFASSFFTPRSATILFDQPGADSLWASDHFGVIAHLASPNSKP